MVEEFDPERFSLRVSQGLFKVLSGRASDPNQIEPRTQREAALIETVRREGYRERLKMLQSVKEEQLKEAYQKEQAAKIALIEKTSALKEKLQDINFPCGPVAEEKQPCANFRTAILKCYRVNGQDNPLACSSEVEAFAECAKQLSKVINS